MKAKKLTKGLNIRISDAEQGRHYSISNLYSTNNGNTICIQQKIKSSLKYGADTSRNVMKFIETLFFFKYLQSSYQYQRNTTKIN